MVMFIFYVNDDIARFSQHMNSRIRTALSQRTSVATVQQQSCSTAKLVAQSTHPQ